MKVLLALSALALTGCSHSPNGYTLRLALGYEGISTSVEYSPGPRVKPLEYPIAPLNTK